MLAAVVSEWVKLRRRSTLGWGLGGALLVSALATGITLERAQKRFPPGQGHHFHATIAQLSEPDGLVRGLLDASSLIGVVALALFAGAVGSEYSQGTLRNLLVRQPHRARLLAGMFTALSAFFAIAVALAIAAAAAVAFALGPSNGIDTSAWTTGTGLNDLAYASLHVYLAAVGYGVLGTALAILLRSPALAIALGVAYVLPGEAIISRLWDGGDRWLPAQLLGAIAHGGTSAATYQHALATTALYTAVAATAVLLLFRHRDVEQAAPPRTGNRPSPRYRRTRRPSRAPSARVAPRAHRVLSQAGGGPDPVAALLIAAVAVTEGRGSWRAAYATATAVEASIAT